MVMKQYIKENEKIQNPSLDFPGKADRRLTNHLVQPRFLKIIHSIKQKYLLLKYHFKHSRDEL